MGRPLLRRPFHRERFAVGIGLDDHRFLGVEVRPLPGPLQIPPHRGQVLIAVLRILLERAADDLEHLVMEPRTQALQWRRVLVQDAVDDAAVKPPGERLPQRQQLVHDGADRKDVAAVVDDLSRDLLRGHVVERANQHPGHGHPGLGDPGDAEIEDLYPAFFLDHDVGRLHVAVDDRHLVREAEAVAQLVEHLQLAGHWRLLLAADDLGERLAVDVLHRDERLSVLFADVEDRDDVGVSQAGDGSGFASEALAKLLHVFPEQLDRNLALEDRVPREIQRAHAALSDAVDDSKATNSGRRLAHRRGSAAIRRLTRGAEDRPQDAGRERCYHGRGGRAGGSRDRSRPCASIMPRSRIIEFATMIGTLDGAADFCS